MPSARKKGEVVSVSAAAPRRIRKAQKSIAQKVRIVNVFFMSFSLSTHRLTSALAPFSSDHCLLLPIRSSIFDTSYMAQHRFWIVGSSDYFICSCQYIGWNR